MSRSLPIADAFCADEAEGAGEPLAGTAAHALVWILVEEPGPWERDPIASEGLVAERATIEKWLAAIPKSRLQLIRRPRASTAARRVYLAMPAERRVLGWNVASLAEVPLVEAAEGEPVSAEIVTGTIQLVCTHGKRDRCCAQKGMPIFRGLDAKPEAGEVWQTSHLGGHRFAATTLELPSGYAFGYLKPEHVDALVAPELPLALVRGRVCFDEPTQFAELALRGALDARDREACLHESTEREENGWHVRFRIGAQVRSVHVRKQALEGLRPKSCGDEPSPIATFVATLEDAPLDPA
ncbi:MAG: hypothetical protein H6721_08315 [Sandaracinus sp.]|nr:hypothetical protein [Sandaracinus sp.]MCB9617064.1 hypothetical protein [Sandaracinus sp.]MCB9623499.1 hypothetical protein [Sandaracinus sp.]MCB9632119.1 hypothetical protein [Sandaracinus sp.]